MSLRLQADRTNVLLEQEREERANLEKHAMRMQFHGCSWADTIIKTNREILLRKEAEMAKMGYHSRPSYTHMITMPRYTTWDNNPYRDDDSQAASVIAGVIVGAIITSAVFAFAIFIL